MKKESDRQKKKIINLLLQNNIINNNGYKYKDINLIKVDVVKSDDCRSLKEIEEVRADVVIDFSSSEGTKEALNFAYNKKMPIVIGTTGLNEEILNLMKKYYRYSDIVFISNKSKLIYTDKPIKLYEKIGTTISLIPLGKVSKVSLNGFLYPLNYEDLEFGRRDGQSNLSISNEQIIDFKKGDLFIVINFKKND